jgi:hypothetical protein
LLFGVYEIQILIIGFRLGRCLVVNKDKTGSDRQSRLRASRVKWLAKNAYGLSAEGLIGALMRGECFLSWAGVPKSRLNMMHGSKVASDKKVTRA